MGCTFKCCLKCVIKVGHLTVIFKNDLVLFKGVIKYGHLTLIFKNGRGGWVVVGINDSKCVSTVWQSFCHHDDVIKWKHFPRYWPFVRGIHRSPVNSPHKGQWRGALMFPLICVWINGWANNREAGDLRRYRAHYVVTVLMYDNPDLQRKYDHYAKPGMVGNKMVLNPQIIALFFISLATLWWLSPWLILQWWNEIWAEEISQNWLKNVISCLMKLLRKLFRVHFMK